MGQEIKLEGGKLTERMIEQYKKDGFLFPINVLTQKQAQNFRRELETIEDRYSSAPQKKLYRNFPSKDDLKTRPNPSASRTLHCPGAHPL